MAAHTIYKYIYINNVEHSTYIYNKQNSKGRNVTAAVSFNLPPRYTRISYDKKLSTVGASLMPFQRARSAGCTFKLRFSFNSVFFIGYGMHLNVPLAD